MQLVHVYSTGSHACTLTQRSEQQVELQSSAHQLHGDTISFVSNKYEINTCVFPFCKNVLAHSVARRNISGDWQDVVVVVVVMVVVVVGDH